MLKKETLIKRLEIFLEKVKTENISVNSISDRIVELGMDLRPNLKELSENLILEELKNYIEKIGTTEMISSSDLAIELVSNHLKENGLFSWFFLTKDNERLLEGIKYHEDDYFFNAKEEMYDYEDPNKELQLNQYIEYGFRYLIEDTIEELNNEMGYQIDNYYINIVDLKLIYNSISNTNSFDKKEIQKDLEIIKEYEINELGCPKVSYSLD
jgi:hypothetical protein